MKKLFACLLFVLAGCAAAQGVKPVGLSSKFDFRGMAVPQVVQLIYGEAVPGSFVIDPEVLTDQRQVSFRYDSGKQGDLRVFIASFFDSLGLSVSHRGGVDFIARKVAAAVVPADDEVFIYRPRYRDGSYLVELVAPLFKGSFTSRRTVHAAPGDEGSAKAVPPGSAAASIDRRSDMLVFSGTVKEVASLKKLLAQVDIASGDVLVQGVLYEVQTGASDSSAYGLALNLLAGKLTGGIGSILASPGRAFASFKNHSIDAVFSALASDNRFKAVSKPMLRVASGKSGRFTVGQDVPVLGSVSYPGAGQAPVQSVTYQSSGVIYDLSPVVHGETIDVSVMQQTSNFVSTTTGVSGSPTLIKREFKSDLTLSNGELVVIGGLSDSKHTNTSEGASFLPAFLRSKSSGSSGVEILLILQVTKL